MTARPGALRLLDPPPNDDERWAPTDTSWIDQIGDDVEREAIQAEGATTGAIRLTSLNAALLEPDDPIPWLWSERHLIAPGRPTIVGAYGGLGKTWLVLAMALSVATGIPFLGASPARRGRAVVLEYETGSRRLRRRLRRLVQGYGIANGTENLLFCAQEDLAVYLTSPDAEAELMSLCTDTELLVVDSLIQSSLGLKENDAEMAGPLYLLARVSAQTGCSVVVIHHERKTADANASSGAGQSLRGHSALQAACDGIWRLSSAGERIEMRATKCSDGPTPNGWDLQIVDTDGGGIVIEAADASSAIATGHSDVDERVLAFLAAHPGSSTRTVRVGVGGRAGTIQDALARLELAGSAESRPGARKSQQWWPTEDRR